MDAKLIANISAELLIRDELRVEPDVLAEIVRTATNKVLEPEEVEAFLSEVAVETTAAAVVMLAERIG